MASDKVKRQVELELDTFYRHASAYVPYKYDVLLYGPAVDGAIELMKQNLNVEQNEGEFVNKGTARAISHGERYDYWKARHYIDADGMTMGSNVTDYDVIGSNINNQHSNTGQYSSPKAIQMRWVAQNVTVPTPELHSSSIECDPFENKKYLFTQGYAHSSNLTFDVLEQDGLMWFQFFNALAMQYFDPTILTVRNSMYVLSATVLPYTTIDKYIDDTPTDKKFNGRYYAAHHSSQVFEYNNIIFGGIGNSIKLSNGEGQPLKYTATFTCPNPFQRSFKDGTVGMRNMIADEVLFKNGKYDKSLYTQ